MLTVMNHPNTIMSWTITIDRAGRIVVPKSLRERFNLVAGTELEIEASGECLRLRKVGAEPALVRKKGILVHRGGERVDLDVAAFIPRGAGVEEPPYSFRGRR